MTTTTSTFIKKVETSVRIATQGGAQEFAYKASIKELAELLQAHSIPSTSKRDNTVYVEVLGTFWRIEMGKDDQTVFFYRHIAPLMGTRFYRPNKSKQDWDVWWLVGLYEREIPLHDPKNEIANKPRRAYANSFYNE